MTPPRAGAGAAAPRRRWEPALEEELRARTERRSGAPEPYACVRWLEARDDRRRVLPACTAQDRPD